METGRWEKLAKMALQELLLTVTIPSIKQVSSGSELLPSISAEEKEPLTFRGTRVSEYAGRWIFLLEIMGKTAWLACGPSLIFLVDAQMDRFALLIKSMPIMQGNCKLSMN